MAYCFLSNRAVVALSGVDVVPFLQGLISNDARKLQQGNAIYAALLSPQGKFLHDFFLLPFAGKILLDVDAVRAPDLLSRLKTYRLRSKVEIEHSDFVVAVVWDADITESENSDIKIIKEPRLGELGFRVVGNRAALEDFFAQKNISVSNVDGYEQHRLTLGVPDGARDMTIDRSLLLECGFEELHGVDFNKGCYVGQEVTARTKFRGQVRKGFYVGHANGGFPAAGTDVFAGEQNVGEVRSSTNNVALLRLNTEVAEASIAGHRTLQSGGIDISISRPIWMKEGIT